MTESFPRQQARTRHFTLGLPRSFQISPDGDRVAFLRSRGGDDPVNCLWVLDVGTGVERLVADPATLGGGTGLTEQEKARRERVREQAAGIVAFASDSALTLAAFVLAGQVYVADLTAGGPAPRAISAAPRRVRPTAGPRRAASRVRLRRRGARGDAGGRMRTRCSSGRTERTGSPSVWPSSWPRRRWAAPAGTGGRRTGPPCWWPGWTRHRCSGGTSRTRPTRAALRPRWPTRRPGRRTRTCHCCWHGWTAARFRSEWDRVAFPYLVTVNWDGADPLIVVQTRDQHRMRLLSADPARGTVAVLREDTDDHWLDIVPGVPARTGDGRIVWTADADGAKRLLVAAPGAARRGGAGHPGRAPGARGRRYRRRRRAVHRVGRGPDGRWAVAARRRRARPAHPGRRGPLRPAGRRHHGAPQPVAGRRPASR